LGKSCRVSAATKKSACVRLAKVVRKGQQKLEESGVSKIRVRGDQGRQEKYLLTSYVSTRAMNPSGKAMAKEMSAANSPSDASSGMTPKRGEILLRH